MASELKTQDILIEMQGAFHIGDLERDMVHCFWAYHDSCSYEKRCLGGYSVAFNTVALCFSSRPGEVKLYDTSCFHG
jgi:hypothetical protein